MEVRLNTRNAIDSYNRDARFRALVNSAISRARAEHCAIDPECVEAEVFRIAQMTAMFLLQSVYEDDAELGRLRFERDTFKAAALRFAQTTPPTLIFQPIVQPKEDR
jgi:hypothetical protein